MIARDDRERQEQLDAWLKGQEIERKRQEAQKDYSLVSAFGESPYPSRYVAWLSENTTADPEIELAWLDSGCPRDSRYYKSFIPYHRARVWQIDLETGEVGPEENPGKLFARRLHQGTVIVHGFNIRFIECGGNGLRGPTIPKHLVGASLFQIVNVSFGWDLGEEFHLREIVGHDETIVRKVMKKLKMGFADSKFDPRGMSRDVFARWP